jgi:NADPH2:quinone reductase
MYGIIMRKYGSTKVLEFVKTLSTKPLLSEFTDTKVIVKITASSVNPLDVRIREGKLYNSYFPLLPHILGKDASGIVVGLGKKVTKFKIGDEVFGCLPQSVPSTGTYCQYTCFDESNLCVKPKEVSHFEAAAIGLAGSTAHHCLIGLGKITKGSVVFINGGSGGVGSLAIQIAKVIGAKVYASCSAENKPYCKNLGADVAFEYKKERFENVFAEKLDMVLDCFGNVDEGIEDFMKTSGKVIGLHSPNTLQTLTRSFVGWFGGISYDYPVVVPTTPLLTAVIKLLVEKKIKMNIDSVVPLIDVATAHEKIASGKTVGKIVLDIDHGYLSNAPKGEKKEVVGVEQEKKEALHDLIHDTPKPETPVEHVEHVPLKEPKVERKGAQPSLDDLIHANEMKSTEKSDESQSMIGEY